MAQSRPIILLAFLATTFLAACTTTSRRSDLYEGCSNGSDCTAVADECFTVDWLEGRGGMCSLYCVDDLDCPGNGMCFELVGDPLESRVCYAPCLDDLDCDLGFLCADAVMGSTVVGAICLPR